MDNKNINSRSLPQLNNFKTFSFSSFVIQQQSSPILKDRFENRSVKNLKESSLLRQKCVTPLVCFPQSHEKHTQTISPEKCNKSCEAIPYSCLQEVQTELSFDANEWQTELKFCGNNTGNDNGTQTEQFSQTFDNQSDTNVCGDSTDKSRDKPIIDSKKKSKAVIKNSDKNKKHLNENGQNNDTNELETVNQVYDQNTVKAKKKFKVKCCIH